MEDKINTSKISILFGDEISDNEKASLQFKLVLSSKAAEDQARHLNTLLKETIDPMNSIVIVLPVSANNQEELERLVKTIFSGEAKTKMSKDIQGAIKKGLLAYEIVCDSEQIIIGIKDNSADKKVLKDLKAFLSKGLSTLTKTQENSINLKFSSLNGFVDIEHYFQQGESFASSLLRSFKAELKLDLDQELTTKGIDVLKALDPKIASSPLGLLSFFKDLNMEFRFGPSDEFPESLRPFLFPSFLKLGMAAASNLPSADKNFWNQFANVAESGIEIYVTAEECGILHIVSNMPGYSKHFLRNINNSVVEL